MRPCLVLAVLLALAACDEMSHQPRYDSDEASKLFKDGKSLQAPPEGTIARDDPSWVAALQQRPPLTMALLQRGQERYSIYCMPCHDAAGTGHGTIPDRGFPRPPSFHDARLRGVAPNRIVDIITKGYGVMYSYADRVEPTDRWAIAAYIKALQLSRSAPATVLSDAERAQLAKVP